ncbi:MAG: hypothetical protein LAT66_11425 [Alkalimonas sp.]|nr:hypothetical protein [Alkalimonas sp.]
MLITTSISSSEQQWLAEQGLRQLSPYFAPNEPAEALFHLLSGQFSGHNQYHQWLQQPPSWLQQSQGRIGLQHQAWADTQLPWSDQFTNPAAPIQLIFSQDIQPHITEVASEQPLLVIELTSQHRQFKLAPAAAWYRWPELRRQVQVSASLHLDILPTLLAQAGCQAEPELVGDALLKPRNIPKIAISQHEIYSFYKDKLVIIREDHSFGVWSAGTLLPLNESFDMPMLVDALQRIPQSPPNSVSGDEQKR